MLNILLTLAACWPSCWRRWRQPPDYGSRFRHPHQRQLRRRPHHWCVRAFDVNYLALFLFHSRTPLTSPPPLHQTTCAASTSSPRPLRSVSLRSARPRALTSPCALSAMTSSPFLPMRSADGGLFNYSESDYCDCPCWYCRLRSLPHSELKCPSSSACVSSTTTLLSVLRSSSSTASRVSPLTGRPWTL